MSEYISKEEALKIVGFEESWLSDTNKSAYDVDIAFHGLKKKIESAPSADVRENIHGQWGRLTRVENVYSIDGVKTWGIKCQCDKCTFTTIVVEGFGFYDYCPHCGSRNEVQADMREPKGEKGTE